MRVEELGGRGDLEKCWGSSTWGWPGEVEVDGDCKGVNSLLSAMVVWGYIDTDLEGTVCI